MTRTLTFSLWTLFILAVATEARAGTIYLETIPAPVNAGSTGNILNIMIDLDATDMPSEIINGYEFELEFASGTGIDLDYGTFRSDTFSDLLPRPLIGGGADPTPTITSFTASGTFKLSPGSPDNPAPGSYGLASIFFDVDPSATSGFITPTLLTGTLLTSEGATLLTLDSSDPGGITISGASGPGSGGSVPEPASLAVWSVLGLVGMARARRRKSKLAAA
ncbi:hypothetical protein [Roseimaritima ulvae]|uniref:PEP-CTERM protein-sorting domain-containing protein n=1 Tax=Roseimaritima ulvae TaxID=980254 RepID=A0A5B9R0T9_9BACT|nr:hypothetical protein [Roseimaritima ulvae]QEG43036.1 hypothetical protein UC8_50790 [Roseimaritima ulvae]